MKRELPRGWEWRNLDDVVEILDNNRIPLKEDDREKRIFGKNIELFPIGFSGICKIICVTGKFSLLIKEIKSVLKSPSTINLIFYTIFFLIFH